MYERTGYDWGSLGSAWGSDPVPGSPEVLENVAATYSASAENLARAAENLRQLRSGEQTRSDAVEKIMEKAVATAGTLDQVQSRYRTVSRVLNTYAPELREAQRMSLEAVEQAGPAVRRREAARVANEQARWRTVTVDQATRDQAMEDYHRTKSAYLAADAELNEARAKLDAAIKKRNAAGERAKQDVGDAIAGSPLNDSIGDYLSAAWEAIKKVTGAVLEWLWEHIDEICLVLDILSVVLALTGVGGPVAAALQLVSKAARVAHVLARIKQGIQLVDFGLHGLRTGDWNNFAAAAAGLGLGILGGKVLGKAAGKFSVKNKFSSLASSRALDHRLTVKVKTDKAVSGVFTETLKNNVPREQIIKKVADGAPLPHYFKAAPTVAKMAGSSNEFAAAASPYVQGAASLMKGGDYSRISPYMNQLSGLSRWPNATIPADQIPKIASIAGERAAAAMETGAGMLKDHVVPYDQPDGLQDSLRRIGVAL